MPGKLGEADARLIALQIAAKRPGHEATTTQIKDGVGDYWEFTPADLAPSPTRNGERVWQQIVGNVVSHQETNTSLFKRGLAERTEDGLRVTEAGIEFLKSQGLYP